MSHEYLYNNIKYYANGKVKNLLYKGVVHIIIKMMKRDRKERAKGNI